MAERPTAEVSMHGASGIAHRRLERSYSRLKQGAIGMLSPRAGNLLRQALINIQRWL